MTGTDEPRDEAVEKELGGVPEEMLDRGEEGDAEHSLDDALGLLRADLEAAQQDMLYARAEVQNVRRRMEKDIQDARAYAATGFARDHPHRVDRPAARPQPAPGHARNPHR